MVSDFISEKDGYLKLTDEEFTVGRTSFPNLRQYGRESIEYGENKDGYWTSERFMEQIRKCADIVQCKYPNYKVVMVLFRKMHLTHTK